MRQSGEVNQAELTGLQRSSLSADPEGSLIIPGNALSDQGVLGGEGSTIGSLRAASVALASTWNMPALERSSLSSDPGESLSMSQTTSMPASEIPPASELCPPRVSSPRTNALANSILARRSTSHMFDEVVRALAIRSRNPQSDGFGFWCENEGPKLLAWANEDLANPVVSMDRQQLVKAVMLLGTSLVSIPEHQEAFANRIGLGLFCDLNTAAIVETLLRSDEQWNANWATTTNDLLRVANSFAAAVPKFCPFVLSSVRLRIISLRHRILKGLSLSTPFVPFLSVIRQRAFEQSFPILILTHRRIGPGTRIAFHNEAAVGEGVRRDWFSEVTKQIFDSETGLFASNQIPYILLSDEPVENRDLKYEAVGRFLGLSILENVAWGVNFSVMFLASIMGTELQLEDIKDDEPILFNSYNQVLSMSADEVDGMDMDVEIGGTIIRLTADNRVDLIHRKVNSLIPPEHTAFVGFIKQGFLEIVPAETLRGYISPADLKAAIYGNRTIEIDDLKRNVVYGYGGYNANSPQIRWLFEFLEFADFEVRKKFLRFVTGISHLPLGGFASLSPPIKIEWFPSSDNLPTSHTCFHKLDLPAYPSQEILAERMTYALTADTGMEIV